MGRAGCGKECPLRAVGRVWTFGFDVRLSGPFWEREVGVLRDDDGAEEEEEDVSLSFAVGSGAVDGWRGIMPWPGSRYEGASMLAKRKSGSSMSLEVLIGAMAFYDGSWRY